MPLDGVTQHRTATRTARVYGTDTMLLGHSAPRPAMLSAAVCRVTEPEDCMDVPSCTNLSVGTAQDLSAIARVLSATRCSTEYYRH